MKSRRVFWICVSTILSCLAAILASSLYYIRRFVNLFGASFAHGLMIGWREVWVGVCLISIATSPIHQSRCVVNEFKHILICNNLVVEWIHDKIYGKLISGGSWLHSCSTAETIQQLWFGGDCLPAQKFCLNLFSEDCFESLHQ